MPTDRPEFLGVRFDALTMEEALARLQQVSASQPFRYAVTPNVDHVVQIAKDGEGTLLPIYEAADLCLCDSRVLALLARLHRLKLPVVPGSDLTRLLLEQVARPGDRIAIVGGDHALLAELQRRFPDLLFVQHVPPMGLRRNAGARQEAAEFVAQSGARFSLLAIGAPQQEMVASAISLLPEARGMALCIGASLDFIVGRQQRAPRLLQRMSLEWAYRLACEPRRMWRRYLVDGPRVFLLAARFNGDNAGR